MAQPVTIGYDLRAFDSKEFKDELKALRCFYKPSIQCWVKRTFIKDGMPEAELLKQLNEFKAKLQARHASIRWELVPYTDLDKIADQERRSRRNARKPETIYIEVPANKPVKLEKAAPVDQNAEIKALLVALLQKLS